MTRTVTPINARNIVRLTSAPTSDPDALAHVRLGLAQIIANADDGKQVFGFDPELASRDAVGGRITALTIGGELAAVVYSYRLSDTLAYLGGLVTLVRGQGLAEQVVRQCLEDRRRVDGRLLRVEAVVRLLPDGRINERSAAVLCRCGFVPTGIVAVDLATFGARAHPALYATAEADGHTIRTVKFVRRGDRGECT